MTNIYERSAMITYGEFKKILHDTLQDELKHFPKTDVENYLLSEFVEKETQKEYEICVERFKKSKLQFPNEVFAAGLSRLDNLLALCFE